MGKFTEEIFFSTLGVEGAAVTLWWLPVNIAHSLPLLPCCVGSHSGGVRLLQGGCRGDSALGGQSAQEQLSAVGEAGWPLRQLPYWTDI